MDPIFQIIVAIIAAFGASSGFWAWMMRRDNRKDATTRLLLGIAHNEIVRSGMIYLSRGWITKDEYEDFVTYLWKPYSEFGGNGLAEKIFSDLSHLPIVAAPPHVVPVQVKEAQDDKPADE